MKAEDFVKEKQRTDDNGYQRIFSDSKHFR